MNQICVMLECTWRTKNRKEKSAIWSITAFASIIIVFKHFGVPFHLKKNKKNLSFYFNCAIFPFFLAHCVVIKEKYHVWVCFLMLYIRLRRIIFTLYWTNLKKKSWIFKEKVSFWLAIILCVCDALEKM